LDPLLAEVRFPDVGSIDSGTSSASLPGLSLGYQDGMGSIDAVGLGEFATGELRLEGVVPDLGPSMRVYFRRDWVIDATEEVTLFVTVSVLDADTGDELRRYTTSASEGGATTGLRLPVGRRVVYDVSFLTIDRFSDVQPDPATPPFDLDLSGEFFFFVVVPEPSSGALLCVGLVTLATRHRRKAR
jgi:hypothetical protein